LLLNAKPEVISFRHSEFGTPFALINTLKL
jgi:hypothetical protein